MTTITASSEVVRGISRADDISGPAQGHWTFEDYARLPDDGNRYEIIEGVLYMAPAPSFFHQRSNARFIARLTTHVVDGGLGEVVGAPIDVKLAPGTSPVQPDVVVILKAHLDRIKPNWIEGALDLVVEIASPGTASYARREKRDAYEAAGVLEYWIADPGSQAIEILVLKEVAEVLACRSVRSTGCSARQRFRQTRSCPVAPQSRRATR